MDSFDPACNNLKHAYEACHKAWLHDEYLPLANQPNSKDLILSKFGAGYVPCKNLFEPYRACLDGAMKKANINLDRVRENLLDKPIEDGLKDEGGKK